MDSERRSFRETIVSIRSYVIYGKRPSWIMAGYPSRRLVPREPPGWLVTAAANNIDIGEYPDGAMTGATLTTAGGRN